MKLTILGSGSCLQTPLRNSSSYYLKIGQDKVLIDCGSGTLRQLVRAKVDYYKLDYIFITHAHPDHLVDLVSLIQSSYIFRKHYHTENKPLNIFGYRGFKRDYDYLSKIFLFNGKVDNHVKTFELSKGQKKFNHWQLKVQGVSHGRIRCQAYRFTHKNKSIIFGSDSDYNKEIIKLCQRGDLAVLDCSYPNRKKFKKGHMTPAECGRAASQAKVKKLILSHIYPLAEKHDLKKLAGKYYRGLIIVAKDLMTINI